MTEGGVPRSLVAGTGGARGSLHFEERKQRGSVGWGTGCNGYSAKTEPTSDTIEIGSPLGSLMDCGRELNRQERWLERFMRSDPQWQLRGHELTLTSGDTVIKLWWAGDPEQLVEAHPTIVDRVCRIFRRLGHGHFIKPVTADKALWAPIHRVARTQDVRPRDLLMELGTGARCLD